MITSNGIKKLSSFWLPIILIFGLILRLYSATAVALWHDEALSVFLTRYSWGEMLHRIGQDVQAPLYYMVLKLWEYPFGSGIFALRLLSIVFGAGAVFCGYLFVKEAFKNEKLAILSALFLAVNPFQIEYSQQVRMYSLGAFLILLASFLLVKALNSNKNWVWAAYALSTTACLYTHYYLIFSLAAHGLYFIYWMWDEKKINRKGVAAFTGSLILFLPWLKVFTAQLHRVQNQAWIMAPSIWSVPATIYRMLFAGFSMETYSLFIITALAATVTVIYFIYETKNKVHWLVLLSVALPFVGVLLVSYKQNLYLDRYFIFASVFFDILIAAAFFMVPKYTTRRTLAAVFIIVSVVFFFQNWQDADASHKPGMKAAAAEVNDQAKPTDKIYVGSSFIYLTLNYYNRTPIHPLLYAPGNMASIPYFSGTAALNQEDLLPDFKSAAKNDTVWLVWTTGYDSSKPNVPGNWQKVNEQLYFDTPDYKGQIFVTQYHIN